MSAVLASVAGDADQHRRRVVAQPHNPRRNTRRQTGRRTLSILAAMLAAIGWLLTLLPPTSFATPREPLTVTATASPASGRMPASGETITYTLKAKSQQPLPAGAVVVDDLAGLSGSAKVT